MHRMLIFPPFISVVYLTLSGGTPLQLWWRFGTVFATTAGRGSRAMEEKFFLTSTLSISPYLSDSILPLSTCLPSDVSTRLPVLLYFSACTAYLSSYLSIRVSTCILTLAWTTYLSTSLLPCVSVCLPTSLRASWLISSWNINLTWQKKKKTTKNRNTHDNASSEKNPKHFGRHTFPPTDRPTNRSVQWVGLIDLTSSDWVSCDSFRSNYFKFWKGTPY